MENPHHPKECGHPLRQLSNGISVCDHCKCVSLVATGKRTTFSLYERCINDIDAYLQENKETWQAAEHEHNSTIVPEALADACHAFRMAKKTIQKLYPSKNSFRDDDYRRTLDKELYTLFQSAEIIEAHCKK